MAQLQTIFDRQKAPARQGNYIELDIPEGRQAAGLSLVLSGPASFSEGMTVKYLELDKLTSYGPIRIHSTGRPGRVILRINGERHILRFEAANLMQGLVFDWLPTLGLSVMLALVLRSFAFASYYVPSQSMEGTLRPGDKFIAEKFSTKVLRQSPKRGEIVIFHHPDHPSETWVKRVIGLPGDLVEIRNQHVWVNNRMLEEEYALVTAELSDFGPVSVPPGNYFVLGDNRSNSLDSRFWGYLPEEYIEGSPVLIFWPLRNAGSLRSAQSEIQD